MAITLCGAVSATDGPDDVKYVSNTGSDDNNGNETNPYLTIGKGITSVNPNGTVNVADGTYYERLTISKNVNLVGQSQENTILDGSNTGRPLTINSGVNVSISLFTIQNGKATGYDAYGGGIANSGNLTLNNCTVKYNQANPTGFYGSSYGGGIYNYGNMTIKGSTVEYNSGTGYYAYGGGINNGGTMIIEDSTVQYNQAISSSDEAKGGGIYNEVILTINNSNINGNTAWSSYPDEAYGGGIYNYGTLIMDNTNMEGNIVRGYSAHGGGIYNYNGIMEISNSNINKNYAEASGSSCYGGGIYINSGSLTLTNSNINQNTVTGQSGYSAEGGGIYNCGATMTITGGSVSSNRANGGDARGGGISNSGGYHNIVTINGCTIQDNAIYSTSTSNGGGIYFHSGPGYNTATMAINDSVIKGNTANYGGGIYNYQSTLNISGSTIQENNAIDGAGIWTSGTATISDSLISHNSASRGGGIYNNGGTLTVSNSTISGNTASPNYGGGIYNNYGTFTLSGSTISGNTATHGAGIYNYEGTVDVSGSTIIGNTAQNFGGGIYNWGTLMVSGSTISGNTATHGAGIFNTAGSVTANFNRIVNNSPKTIYRSGGSVDARYNWWGSNDPDFITLISGVVDYNPWLYMTLQANPTTIHQGETSTLTASFNNAFDGTTITLLDPIDGHIPDKTPVTFNTDLGSVGSKTINKETINGVATATLTADEAAGIANVSAVTDSQILNTKVIINPTITTTENKKNLQGQNVELKAAVKDDEGNNVNEGQVRFRVNNNVVGIANVINGQAVLNWTIPSNWAPGNKIILAEFLGTDNYSTSDGTANLTVVLKPAAWANVKGGLFNVNKNVYLYKNIQTGTRYYTRNGSTPTNASTKYTGYISISSSTTLKFIAIDQDGNKSPVYTEKYVIDKTAPKVTYTYPKNLSTGQSRTATLYLKFSEKIKASTYWSKIYVKDLKTAKKVVITKWIKGNILYIKTRYKRPSLRWFQVYVPYKAVKDYAGNNLVRTYSYKFKTRS